MSMLNPLPRSHMSGRDLKHRAILLDVKWATDLLPWLHHRFRRQLQRDKIKILSWVEQILVHTRDPLPRSTPRSPFQQHHQICTLSLETRRTFHNLSGRTFNQTNCSLRDQPVCKLISSHLRRPTIWIQTWCLKWECISKCQTRVKHLSFLRGCEADNLV